MNDKTNKQSSSIGLWVTDAQILRAAQIAWAEAAEADALDEEDDDCSWEDLDDQEKGVWIAEATRWADLLAPDELDCL